MYELIIEKNKKIIKLIIDDYNSPEVRKLIEQPDITSVEWHKIKTKVRSKKNEMARNSENET